MGTGSNKKQQIKDSRIISILLSYLLFVDMWSLCVTLAGQELAYIDQAHSELAVIFCLCFLSANIAATTIPSHDTASGQMFVAASLLQSLLH